MALGSSNLADSTFNKYMNKNIFNNKSSKAAVGLKNSFFGLSYTGTSIFKSSTHNTIIALALLQNGDISVKYSNILFENMNSHLVLDCTNNLVYQIDSPIWYMLGVALFAAAYCILPGRKDLSKSLDLASFKEHIASNTDPLKESVISASTSLKERLPSIIDCVNSRSYSIYDYLPSDVVNYKTTFYEGLMHINNHLDFLSTTGSKTIPIIIGGHIIVHMVNNLPSNVNGSAISNTAPYFMPNGYNSLIDSNMREYRFTGGHRARISDQVLQMLEEQLWWDNYTHNNNNGVRDYFNNLYYEIDRDFSRLETSINNLYSRYNEYIPAGVISPTGNAFIRDSLPRPFNSNPTPADNIRYWENVIHGDYIRLINNLIRLDFINLIFNPFLPRDNHYLQSMNRNLISMLIRLNGPDFGNYYDLFRPRRFRGVLLMRGSVDYLDNSWTRLHNLLNDHRLIYIASRYTQFNLFHVNEFEEIEYI